MQVIESLKRMSALKCIDFHKVDAGLSLLILIGSLIPFNSSHGRQIGSIWKDNLVDLQFTLQSNRNLKKEERPLSDVSKKMKGDANVKYIDQCSSMLNSSAPVISIHWKHHLYQELFLLIKIWPKSLPLICAITSSIGLTLSPDFS